MIDLKQLRENPEHFREGAVAKNASVDIEHVLELDSRTRRLRTEQEEARAEQKRLGKKSGPQIGRLKGTLKSADDSRGPESRRRSRNWSANRSS
jgi:seryl-tRNA synthetase